jgi:hypothetical protein
MSSSFRCKTYSSTMTALLQASSRARIRRRRNIKLYVHYLSSSYILVRFKCKHCLGNVGRIWGQRLYVMWKCDVLLVNVGRTGRMCVCVCVVSRCFISECLQNWGIEAVCCVRTFMFFLVNFDTTGWREVVWRMWIWCFIIECWQNWRLESVFRVEMWCVISECKLYKVVQIWPGLICM